MLESATDSRYCSKRVCLRVCYVETSHRSSSVSTYESGSRIGYALHQSGCAQGEVLEIPIAHGDGNYFTDGRTLERLEEKGQVVFRYCNAAGAISEAANPNGSLRNIAGIMNEQDNVMGLMPHLERASDPLLRHVDGQKFFKLIIESFVSRSMGHSLISAGGGGR